AWVPADAGRCLTFSWDSRDLLTAIGCLFDRMTGKPGDFIAVVDALRDDKEGPQGDVRKEILGRLTGQATLLSDCPAELADGGEGMLAAFELRDEKPLAAAIGRLLAGEQGVSRRGFHGQPGWEIDVRPRKLKDGSTLELPHLAIAVNGGR